MEIIIDGKNGKHYVLKSDGHQYAVGQLIPLKGEIDKFIRRTKVDGTVGSLQTLNTRYFGDLQSALYRIRSQIVSDLDGIATLEDLLKAIKETDNYIKSLLPESEGGSNGDDERRSPKGD